MPSLTFYPLGNADTCLVDTVNGRKLLFDYAHTKCAEDPNDRRINLRAELRSNLTRAGRDDVDVFALSHLDADHFKNSTEFFYLEHSAEYQDEDRIKIRELWVPAAVIVEEKESLGDDNEHLILQAEARYRLKNKSGIRVFSTPGLLTDWLASQGMTVDDVAHLITDAGNLVPGFDRAVDGVEFFVHSPFAQRLDDCSLVNRNADSLVVQATFLASGRETKVILGADTTYDIWEKIVAVTTWKEREERLEWDVFKLSHHCSYTSLAAERGAEKTDPPENVRWLFETKGREKCVIVSPSKTIPNDDADDQPPHRQAASYYRDVVRPKDGEFVVTMDHPRLSQPGPMVIEIDGLGARLVRGSQGGGAAIIGGPAPRAGNNDER